jgi:hypothetical protein
MLRVAVEIIPGDCRSLRRAIKSRKSRNHDGGQAMLRIMVELIPGGFSPLRRKIASMDIGNISDLAEVSDYKIDAIESANSLIATPARSASCIVRQHNRNQSVWALVARAATDIQQAKFDDV